MALFADFAYVFDLRVSDTIRGITSGTKIDDCKLPYAKQDRTGGACHGGLVRPEMLGSVL
jgi:hypothetical protein